MPVLLGHHGRGKILSWTWRYPTTAVVTSLHGREEKSSRPWEANSICSLMQEER